ncbi:putative ribonuclease H-like domain-containing protein [Tanacetum coccineum]
MSADLCETPAVTIANNLTLSYSPSLSISKEFVEKHHLLEYQSSETVGISLLFSSSKQSFDHSLCALQVILDALNLQANHVKLDLQRTNLNFLCSSTFSGGIAGVERNCQRPLNCSHGLYFKFSWVFFLAYKDETYDMLHDLIVGLENRLRHKVKTIRCDHGTEFKNPELMNEFCCQEGITRKFYSIAELHSKMVLQKERIGLLIEAC